MDNEIELRPYVELLLKRWMWIVAAVVIAAGLAFGVSSLFPPTYEATALVAISEPRLLVQFDPRIESVDENQPLKAFPELAESDGLLLALLNELEPSTESLNGLEELRGVVEARSGSDPSLVRLSARSGDPDAAARIANTWAGLFVARANAVFGRQNGEQVLFFENQLDAARVELESSEEALIEFQTRDRASTIDNEMLSLGDSQARYLVDLQMINQLVRDIRGLRDQMAQRSGDTITFADQLTALTLQLKAFNADNESPFQLQISAAEPVGDEARSDQIEYLDSLVETLETRLEQIDEQLAELEPQILELQREKQEIETERVRLTRDMEVADETYTALARKVEEERIASEETVSGVRLASSAAVPERPVGPRRLINTAMAGISAMLLAVVIIVLLAWWKGSSNQEAD